MPAVGSAGSSAAAESASDLLLPVVTCRLKQGQKKPQERTCESVGEASYQQGIHEFHIPCSTGQTLDRENGKLVQTPVEVLKMAVLTL